MVQLRQDKSLHQISQRQLIAKGSNKGKAKKYGGGGEDESVSLFLFRTHTHTHTHGNRYSEQAVRFLAKWTKLCCSIDEGETNRE